IPAARAQRDEPPSCAVAGQATGTSIPTARTVSSAAGVSCHAAGAQPRCDRAIAGLMACPGTAMDLASARVVHFQTRSSDLRAAEAEAQTLAACAQVLDRLALETHLESFGVCAWR